MKLKLRLTFISVFILTAFTIGTVWAEMELTQISDSVYSFVGIPDGTPGHAFSANAGIVVGEKEVLVVDTLTSAKEATEFLRAIRQVTDKPIGYVVNTHYHLDHSLGNCVFADQGVQIVSHQKCHDAINENGDGILKNPAMFGFDSDFWEGTTIVPPNITFERNMEVDLGNLTVKLVHSGETSHSAGSIFVFIPEEDVLFSGDILFTDYHPYLAEGDLEGWATTLDLIASMNVKKIIPGHGPLSTNQDLADMKTYLVEFDKHAQKLSASETDPEKIIEQMMSVIPHRSGGANIVGYNMMNRYIKKVEQGSTQKP